MGYQSVRWDKLPEVCKGCRFHDSDSSDEYSHNYHFCTKGLFLPTKSNQCKVKNKYKSQLTKCISPICWNCNGTGFDKDGNECTFNDQPPF